MLHVLKFKGKVDKGAAFKAHVKQHPDLVYIQDGRILKDGLAAGKWEGYVNTIPYNSGVVTKHSGSTFLFKKEMDGTFSVT